MDVELEDVLQQVARDLLAHGYPALRDVETGILRGAWEGRSYEEISQQLGYQTGTLRGGYGHRLWQLLRQMWSEPKLNKSNFRRMATQRLQTSLTPAPDQASQTGPHHFLESLDRDLPSFGRASEVTALLEQIQAGKRLIMITGASGIGKTSFLSAVVRHCEDQFEVIFYCRGYEVPSLAEWYATFCQALPDLAETSTGTQDGTQDRRILELLRRYRCLLIFDQTHPLLEDQPSGSPYRPRPDYQRLLQRAVESSHNSCLLWVSQGRLSADIALMSGVDEMPLQPLTATETQALIQLSPWSLTGSETDWKQLTVACGGNADVLIAAAAYLARQHGGCIVDSSHWQSIPEIDDLLNPKFAQLDDIEQALLYLLSIQAQTPAAVKGWTLALPVPTDQVQQAIERLKYRHLISQSAVQQPLRLQIPVMARYLMSRLARAIATELQTETLGLFHRYPLLIPYALAPERLTQTQTLLQPVVDSLHRICQGSPERLRSKLSRLLEHVRQSPYAQQTQATGNLLNIASGLNLSMAGTDLSQLGIAHADLSGLDLREANLSSCRLHQTRWATGLKGALVTALSPCGQTLAVADDHGLVNVYDLTHPAVGRLAHCQRLPAAVTQLALGSRGLLTLASSDHPLRLWSMGSPLAAPDGSVLPGRVQCLGLAADAQWVAAGLHNGQITLVNASWEAATHFSAAKTAIQAVSLSANGNQLAAWGWGDSHIRQWSIDNPEQPTQTDSIHLSRYGTFLAMGWQEQTLQIAESADDRVCLRCSTGQLYRLIDPPDPTDMAAFSNNGQYLILAGTQHICVYATTPLTPASDTLEPVYRLRREANNGLSGLSIGDNGHRFIETALTHVSVWEQGQRLRTLTVTAQALPYQGCQLTGAQGLTSEEGEIAQYLGALI